MLSNIFCSTFLATGWSTDVVHQLHSACYCGREQLMNSCGSKPPSSWQCQFFKMNKGNHDSLASWGLSWQQCNVHSTMSLSPWPWGLHGAPSTALRTPRAKPALRRSRPLPTRPWLSWPAAAKVGPGPSWGSAPPGPCTIYSLVLNLLPSVLSQNPR